MVNQPKKILWTSSFSMGITFSELEELLTALDRRIYGIFTVEIDTHRKRFLAVDDELAVAPDEGGLCEMDDLSSTFVVDEGLRVEAEDDGLADNRAVGQLIVFRECILRESPHDLLVGQLSDKDHIGSAYNVLSDGLGDLLS
jgi:hypothetical protein